MKTDQELRNIILDSLFSLRSRAQKTDDKKTLIEVQKISSAFRLLTKEPMKDIEPSVDVTKELIREAIFYATGIEYEVYRKANRKRELAECRQIEAYLRKKFMKDSLTLIGMSFQGRCGKWQDHSTIINSITVVEDLLVTNTTFRHKVGRIENYIREKLKEASTKLMIRTTPKPCEILNQKEAI